MKKQPLIKDLGPSIKTGFDKFMGAASQALTPEQNKPAAYFAEKEKTRQQTEKQEAQQEEVKEGQKLKGGMSKMSEITEGMTKRVDDKGRTIYGEGDTPAFPSWVVDDETGEQVAFTREGLARLEMGSFEQRQADKVLRETQIKEALSGGVQQGQEGQQGGLMDETMDPTRINGRQVALSMMADTSLLNQLMGAGAAGFIAAGSKGMIGGPKVGLAVGLTGAALAIGASAMKNIGNQKSDNLNAALQTFRIGQQNNDKLINLMNMDPDNAAHYIGLYNENSARMRQAYSQVKRDTQTNLNLALGEDGTREMARMRAYYAMGGGETIQETKKMLAVAQPDFDKGFKGIMMSEMGVSND
jgi:hypothetical protein